MLTLSAKGEMQVRQEYTSSRCAKGSVAAKERSRDDASRVAKGGVEKATVDSAPDSILTSTAHKDGETTARDGEEMFTLNPYEAVKRAKLLVGSKDSLLS